MGAMTVDDIMAKRVLTIHVHSNVGNAVRMMAASNIGSLVVSDSSGPLGVFSERDLLSKVLARGKDPDATVISEVFAPRFVSVERGTTILLAAKTMMKRKSRVMVFDGADLVGIVTATDLVRAIRSFDRPLDLTNVMSARVAVELPETPLAMVVRRMAEERIGSVLVSENDRPYGIFTERDLLLKVLAHKRSLDSTVGEFASSPLVVAPISIDGVQAATMMVASRIKRLPLKKDDKIAGIVTARDIVEAFASQAEKQEGLAPMASG